ncbi:MAG: chemotaxis protein CheA [Planktothrix sp.]|uniref:chemotaxis protein CheA n=1 Tax=Planktothrix sp. TaxID=3088171 RepID=UPI0038D4FA28
MSNPPNNNFFEDFLEDYFAECEEHLAVVRRELLTLESWINKSHIEISHLNELFRCFHSLKGLSGMVGVGMAEELAHQMESYLRVLRDQQIVLSSEGFDALIAGTKRLEQVITCYRNQTPPPDITDICTQLQAVIPTQTLENNLLSGLVTPVEFKLKPQEQEQINTALNNGETLWHFVFSPSTQLSEQGIRVNTIREELQTLGRLIYTAPRMSEGNKILFDLILATALPELPFQQTPQPGLTWQPYLTGANSQKSEITAQELTFSPPAPDLPAPSASPLPLSSSNVVRVDLPKLDDLMRMVGDLVMSRARLEDQIQSITSYLPSPQIRAFQEINLMLERQLRDLRQGVMQVRLVPVGEIFARMQFVVRDLVRTSEKQVSLEMSGQETEIDKFVVERMLDPLLHLVRNAVSHGIESPEERQKVGKPRQGIIKLLATTSGETVIIEIEDDGRGVDIETVIERVETQTHLSETRSFVQMLKDKSGESGKPDQYNMMALLDILCCAGFSTKEEADLVSGRGVGMSIVKNTVQELGGFLSLETHKGVGTRFTIQLPLTLAIIDALIITVGQQTFAIPQSAVLEVLEVSKSQIIAFENNEIVSYRNTVFPLIRLAKIFSLSTLHPELSPPPQTESSSLMIIVIGSGESIVALVVDRITGLREIVVTPLTDPYVQVMGIAGATELGDRRVVLILDVGALVRLATLG